MKLDENHDYTCKYIHTSTRHVFRYPTVCFHNFCLPMIYLIVNSPPLLFTKRLDLKRVLYNNSSLASSDFYLQDILLRNTYWNLITIIYLTFFMYTDRKTSNVFISLFFRGECVYFTFDLRGLHRYFLIVIICISLLIVKYGIDGLF